MTKIRPTTQLSRTQRPEKVAHRVLDMSDPVFPLYVVTYIFDCGPGTDEETTSLMKPWLFKSDPGAAAVEKQARDKWPSINWRGEPKNRRLLRIEVTRKDDVPWAVGWFSHETFRDGRTDEQLRESFGRWVDRWEQYQDHLSERPGTPCLMGAEDRWRWQPFCTCETCKRTEIAMIEH